MAIAARRMGGTIINKIRRSAMWRLYHATPSLTVVLIAILVKELDEGTAGREWVVVLLEDLAQILIN